ncbi:MAG: pilus assembly protein PilP [Oceanicoccus sp.]|uniref:pilus assembly protein PilP n=1 Tax=Oceanicoccus sp. TaxID=2691044 RepID=UPI0026137540|nr:pilus assembly protein PilP [Oceanicoccus sp.]MCP3908557.1 pilus assembly protein PilP [Oceanicoccus sp.]MDG1772994.1 pilus assembly protein PilP [Oceanicoccus sp.]
MPNVFSKILLVVSVITLTACGGGGYEDLDDFMAEKKSRPAGLIKPIPVFKAYKAFTYSASALRSPFERPVEVTEITRLRMASNVKPDPNRTKEYLEQFPLDSLSMVGTLQQGDALWALMQDETGGVHRIKLGDYVGRNHGRIVESTETYVSVIEIVPNGVDGWIERPRTIQLKTIEEE